MAVNLRAAMPGQVLNDRQHAARKQPVDLRSAQRRDGIAAAAQRAVADRLGRALDGNVQDRNAVDRDPDVEQVERHEPGTYMGGFDPKQRVCLVNPPIDRARRIGPEMRRADALDPAALLVDENGRVLTPQRFAHRPAEPADLSEAFNIALEEDDAPGLRFAQEAPLVLAKRRFPQAADEGALRHAALPTRAVIARRSSCRRPPSMPRRPR